MRERIESLIRNYWHLGALFLIVWLAYVLRSYSAGIEYLKAFDPFFQFRYTRYVVENGILPAWDPLSYYPPGRPLNAPPLLYYVTGYLYLLFQRFVQMPLMEFVKYMPAVYTALAAIPTYLLGKEFASREAGLLGAFFVVTIPAILSRTMMGFYDTDPFVIFFSIFTMYLFARLLKRVDLTDLRNRDVAAWRELSIATVGLILAVLAWRPIVYIPIIAVGSVFVYTGLDILYEREWTAITILALSTLVLGWAAVRFGPAIPLLVLSLVFILVLYGLAPDLFRDEFLEKLPAPLIAMVVGVSVVQFLGYPAWQQLDFLLTFAQNPSQILIVNVSVAELQHVNIFGGGMRQLFSRVSVPVVLTLAGAIMLLKKDRLMGSLLLTWAGLSFFSITQGIRFMLVFAPAAAMSAGVALAELYRDSGRLGRYSVPVSIIFLAAVLLPLQGNALVAASLATLTALIILIIKEEETASDLPRTVAVGTIIVAMVMVLSQGNQVALARAGGDSINSNWEETYFWIQNNTAEDAVIGTWWDPGHQITGFANRRAIADGAHCGVRCSPGLNTRITDLGKIFSTTNETEAAQTLMKYRGDASEMYWIASDDLIGKFRWLQYFGTGCDGTGQYTTGGRQRCPLFSQIGRQDVLRGEDGSIRGYQYEGNMKIVFNERDVPIVILERETGQDETQRLTFNRQIAHVNGRPTSMSLNTSADGTLDGTVWIHPNFSSLVHIPSHLEDSMFVRMYFEQQDEELQYFDLVFRNSQIKLYRLDMEKVPGGSTGQAPSQSLPVETS